MLKHNFIALVFLFSASFATANDRFPEGPRESVTPGSLCEKPDDYRYPERIPYCERSVEPDLKKQIIADYDQRFGYRIAQMDRTQFKIDHYIPLCMGGSNEVDNLWPQHISIYEVTDPLEELICSKMAEGVLKQKRAIEYIREVKNDLQRAEDIYSQVSQL